MIHLAWGRPTESFLARGIARRPPSVHDASPWGARPPPRAGALAPAAAGCGIVATAGPLPQSPRQAHRALRVGGGPIFASLQAPVTPTRLLWLFWITEICPFFLCWQIFGRQLIIIQTLQDEFCSPVFAKVLQPVCACNESVKIRFTLRNRASFDQKNAHLALVRTHSMTFPPGTLPGVKVPGRELIQHCQKIRCLLYGIVGLFTVRAYCSRQTEQPG